MKIRDLEIWRLRGERQPSEGFAGWIQCNPSQIFDSSPPDPRQFRAPRNPRPSPYEALYLKILTDRGVEGLYGPIDYEAAIVVDRQLKAALVGTDPLPVEHVWERMFRMNRHSRAGHFMMGISAVDNALWDLKGRHRGLPVRKMISRTARRKVEVYASCLGYSVEPKAVRERCRKVARQGFRRQKWFIAYGPSKGSAGMRWNLELVRALRETLEGGTDIMFDTFMGWDLDYAMEWARKAEQWNPRWIEEAFMPDRVEMFAALARSTRIPVASGEHLYNRYEVGRYLDADALTVVQADPEWCGGVTELTRICALAEKHGAIVVPHGHGLHAALQVVASQPVAVCPYGEYLLNKMDHHHLFEKHPLRAAGGAVALPDRPGFGIELDDSRIRARQRLSWS
jgi:L-alanine-DL-glutamate epimerase-like enolase superfamily enzyme